MHIKKSVTRRLQNRISVHPKIKRAPNPQVVSSKSRYRPRVMCSMFQEQSYSTGHESESSTSRLQRILSHSSNMQIAPSQRLAVFYSLPSSKARRACDALQLPSIVHEEILSEIKKICSTVEISKTVASEDESPPALNSSESSPSPGRKQLESTWRSWRLPKKNFRFTFLLWNYSTSNSGHSSVISCCARAYSEARNLTKMTSPSVKILSPLDPITFSD